MAECGTWTAIPQFTTSIAGALRYQEKAQDAGPVDSATKRLHHRIDDKLNFNYGMAPMPQAHKHDFD